MKRVVLVSVCVLPASFLLGLAHLALAQDAGVPDTLYVEAYPPDVQSSKDPYYFVRFPVRVTHDITDPVDSLAGFVIPLCYTHSNSSGYCSLSSCWNTCYLCGWKGLYERDIFRHLDGEENWFMANAPPSPFTPWSGFLDLDGTSHFWLSIVASGAPGGPRFPDGSRILIATMTFRLDDSTTICIDSCFWPPTAHLAFANSAAQTYVPRDNMPICETVGLFPGPPFFSECPQNEYHSQNGSGFTSSPFAVETFPPGGEIASVSVDFTESGLDNVSLVYTAPPPAEHVEGYVTYDVVDHCGPGGTIVLTALTPAEAEGYCQFDVVLANDPPVLTLPDTMFALAGVTCAFHVPATDPNDDAVETSLNALWFEPDSLQPPINPPSYIGGNPGVFSWEPTETEQGPWICSFAATDACGAEDTRQMTILVGPVFCGDATGEGEVTIADIVLLIHWLYKDGPPPDPLCRGDANCDGVVDISDVVRLINYLYKWDSAPCFDCCERGL